LRNIAVAYKDLRANEGGQDHDDVSDDHVNRVIERSDLTLICIFGIKDILRDLVPEAVATCQRAQIAVRMVTGDHIVTATAIAKECGILP